MSGLTRMSVTVLALQTSLLNLAGIDIIQELAVPPKAVCVCNIPSYTARCVKVYIG